jgi:hypothetical protein
VRFDGVEAKLRLDLASFQSPVSSLEIRMQEIASAYRGIEDKTMYLVFEEGKLLPEERSRLMPSLEHLCDEATRGAKPHDGGGEEKMVTFGVARHATPVSQPRSATLRVGIATARAQARMIEPRRGTANLVEEAVTTVVEEVAIPIEETRRQPARALRSTSKRSHAKR